MGRQLRNLSVCVLFTALDGAGFTTPAAFALTISEVSYHPREGGRTLEYIEIHNELTDPVDLTGYSFRGVEFTFPEHSFLGPRAYLVVCADHRAVRRVFGIENALGDWRPSSALANDGERIELVGPGGFVAASVKYGDRAPWPAGADGTGHTLELSRPYSDGSLPENWALSTQPGGSPGGGYTPPEREGVVLNEAFLDDPIAGRRWLEIYNGSSASVDLGGYHVSTRPATSPPAMLPSPSVIPPGGWLTFTAAELDLALGLDKDGNLFVALSEPGGVRVVDAVVFSPNAPGRSDARLPDGAAARSRAATPSPAAPNHAPVRKDIVINEIHYHPLVTGAPSDQGETTGAASTALEFIELFHRGTEAASLDGWRFSDGVQFDFPAGTMLQAGDYLVISRDPARLQTLYDLPSSAVLGPRTNEARKRFGRLSNAGERLTLKDALGNVVDSVRYHDGGEWAAWPDGGGPSLELIDPRQDNAVGSSWDASLDSAEAPTQKIEYTGRFTGPDSPGVAELHLVLGGRGMVLVDAIEMREEIQTLDESTELIPRGDPWEFFKGTQTPSNPIEAWRVGEFDASGWLRGVTPIGFGFADEGTRLEDMRRNYGSVFFRHLFTLEPEDLRRDLVLEVDYDDGFAAYINGVEVAMEHLRDGERDHSLLAAGQHHETARLLLHAATLPLRAGENLLAVQVHNAVRANGDFRFDAALSVGRLVSTRGPNLIVDGDFELSDEARTPWPASSSNTAWTIEGTHVRSGRSTKTPLEGEASLKIVATAGGDNKVNRIETSNSGIEAPPLDAIVSISFLARWLVGSTTLLTHGSYSDARSPSYAASHRLEVPARFGTPGAENSVSQRQREQSGSVNLGPVIAEVRRSPAVPSENVPVTITARVVDADEVHSVSLHYTLDTPRAEDHPEVFAIELVGPDSSGLYRAEVPSQPVGRCVLFWLTAKDTTGQAGRYPLAHLERTYPLALDHTQTQPEDARYAVYRHEPGDRVAGDHHSYRFLLHAAAEAYLESRAILSNDPVEGTFIFDDADVYDVTQIRFSGSPFARGAPWLGSFRVRLPKDRPLHERLEKFNLEHHQGEGGKDARERVSHFFIRHNQGKSRVPYARQWIVEMRLNDQIDGVFKEHVEVPGREYLSRWFPDRDDGPFFEMDDRHNINDGGTRTQSQDSRLLFPPYGAAGLGNDPEEYRYYFAPRGGTTEEDFDALIELARLMTPGVTSDAAFDQRVDEMIDVEQFLRVWGIRLNTDDWDTWGARRGKNAYLYLPPETGRWILLPWDMELTYGESGSFLAPSIRPDTNPLFRNAFPEVERFLNRPRIKRRYYAILRELALGPFQASFYGPYFEQLESIGLKQLPTIRNFLSSRQRFLLAATEGLTSPATSFALKTHERGAGELILRGSAPLEVEQIYILVDGVTQTVEFVPRLGVDHPLDWEAHGRLPPGRHVVTCLAFDGQGEAFGSATLELVAIAEKSTPFIRGDSDGSGRVNLRDVIWTFLAMDGTISLRCPDAADTNDSGSVDLTDLVHTAEFLFRRGAPPAAPFPQSGVDPTDDALGCD